MIRECLDIKIHESMVQWRSDATPPEAKCVRTEDTSVNESNLKE